MMGWYGGSGWGIGAWMAMGVGMVVFWGLVILVVVALVRGSSRSRGHRTPPMPPSAAGYTAIDYLDDRFARGEITQEEYLHMRDTLLGR